MRTAVTKRGQTVTPAAMRKRYGMEEDDRIEWIDDGRGTRVAQHPASPGRPAGPGKTGRARRAPTRFAQGGPGS